MPDPTEYPKLRGEIRVDVAILGAGITGLTAAVLLKERGRTVAVIEKDRIASGASGLTTAHLTESIDARYHFIRRAHGADAARLVAEASRAAIERIAELVEKHTINCRFRRLPGFLYTENRKYVAGIKKEAVSAREAGLAVSWTESVPLPFPTRGGVRFENQAQMDPVPYLTALAALVPGDGSHLFEQTGSLETPDGRITADVVFDATNTPMESFQSFRTYAIALESDDPRDGLFWDTAEPYHYTRWQDDTLIIGGEDHPVSRDEDPEACFARLMEYITPRYGERRVLRRWSGPIFEPPDGLPRIGRSGDRFVSTGYAGQGMTLGTAGAMLVTDLITGVDNPWEGLFDPGRA